MTDWGAHHNDIAQWGLGMDGSGPVSVTATGVKPSDKPNSYNCHPHFAVTFTYADGTHLVTTSDGENGNRFIGDKGWIFVNRERIEASDKKLLEEPLPREAVKLYVSNDHMGNFMDGIGHAEAADLRRRGGLPVGDGLPPGRDRAAAGHSAQLGPQGREVRRPPRRQGQRDDLARNALALAARDLIEYAGHASFPPLAKGGSGGVVPAHGNASTANTGELSRAFRSIWPSPGS